MEMATTAIHWYQELHQSYINSKKFQSLTIHAPATLFNVHTSEVDHLHDTMIVESHWQCQRWKKTVSLAFESKFYIK